MFPYDTAWELAGERVRGPLDVWVQVTAGGGPLPVDAATLVIRTPNGTEVRREPMSWVAADQRYHAHVVGLAHGRYVLDAELVVETWDVPVAGPAINKR